MYAGFYPQITADAAESVPEAMRGFGFEDPASAAGYLQGAVFGLLATWPTPSAVHACCCADSPRSRQAPS